MKNIYLLSIVFFLSSILSLSFAQNVGINETGGTPHRSAGLDIDFSNKGLLIPRVALQADTDVTTIDSPAVSLLVYNTNDLMLNGAKGFWYWNGSLWVQIFKQGPWKNQGTHLFSEDNYDRIYQSGPVAVNKNDHFIYDAALDVRGAIRGGEINSNDTIGVNSLAVGDSVVASGKGAVAFGKNMLASGDGSFAMGDATGELWQDPSIGIFPAPRTPSIASGRSSFVFGYGNQAKGELGIAMGLNNYVEGTSQVHGVANGVYGGNGNFVVGIGDTVFGGFYNTVIGANNRVDSNAFTSFIAGQQNRLSVLNGVVFGQFNAITESLPAGSGGINGRRHQAYFQIGNGRNEANRHNALTILQQGFVGIGIDGTGEAAKPQYTLDIGKHTYYSDGKGGMVRMQKLPELNGSINDKLVVVDTGGVLRSINHSSFPTNISSIKSVSQNYTVLMTDATIVANATKTITITLPDPQSIEMGVKYIVKKKGDNHTVNITSSGSATIDGQTTISGSSPYQAWEMQSDGAEWLIIGTN